MPSKDTDILTVRAPSDLADAVRAEAKRRKLSVSALLNKYIDAACGQGTDVQKKSSRGQEADPPAGFALERDQ